MHPQMYLAYDYPLLSVFLTVLWLGLWILWFLLLFRVVLDIFRDGDLGGWGKAGWLALVIVLPFLGVLVYLLARGKDMGSREVARMRARQKEFDAYVRQTADSGPSSVDELARLSDMRARGDLTEQEFDQAKQLVLTGGGPAGRATSITRPADR